MLLYANGIHLHWHQKQIDGKENQIHFQNVLLFKRKVIRESAGRRLFGIAIHQLNVVVDVIVLFRSVRKFFRIEMVPCTSCVTIAGYNGNVPKSGNDGMFVGY